MLFGKFYIVRLVFGWVSRGGIMQKNNSNENNLGFENKLWLAADKLRNNMDAAEYKHVVLGLIFLKYISDAFEEKHEQLQENFAKVH